MVRNSPFVIGITDPICHCELNTPFPDVTETCCAFTATFNSTCQKECLLVSIKGRMSVIHAKIIPQNMTPSSACKADPPIAMSCNTN